MATLKLKEQSLSNYLSDLAGLVWADPNVVLRKRRSANITMQKHHRRVEI
jgi:hypothetical protein